MTYPPTRRTTALGKWEEPLPKAAKGKLSELWKAARKECVALNLVF